jgi:steroid delta-isomerase-like uncharacterized protein
MSTDAYKAMARQFVEEVWGQGDLALADVLLAPDCIDHTPGPGLTPDRAGHHRLLQQVRTAFPDAHFMLEDVVVEGDRVVDRWTMDATHSGPLGGIAPTGKRVRLTGMDIFRVAEGQIVELWHLENTLSLLQQLGVVPGPGAAAQQRG